LALTRRSQQPFGARTLSDAITPPADAGLAAPPARRRPPWRTRSAAWLHGLSPRAASALAVALAGLVTFGDYVTGPDVSFTLLYLGPIGFATWFVSAELGIALSAASAVASCAVDLATTALPFGPAVVSWNLAVQLGVFIALVLLLAALKDRLEAEQQLARTDPLTHLANRRAFVEQAAVEVERARRTGRPLTVAYLDCDDFKVINDRFGHAQGDLLLGAAATTLRTSTRALDTVARLGGDEFGLLLVDTDGSTAEALVQRLRTALQATMASYGWIVTFSIGAVTFLAPPQSVDDMLGHADGLMYEAKRSGKDGARFEVVGSQLSLRLDRIAS
jgi:diguanylate cyclase (GGDEF)-like protein